MESDIRCHQHRSDEQMEIMMMNEHENINNYNADRNNKTSSRVQQQQQPIYKECRKNHALNVSGFAVDGCGEFMPAGPEDSLEALKCAACGCHRNFHRKEGDVGPSTAAVAFSPPAVLLVSHNMSAAAAPSSVINLQLGPPPASNCSGQDQEGDVSNPGRKRRFRSKFTDDQKARMLEMAERIEWRISTCNEELLDQFLNEIDVPRHVFKVWMHNNKNTFVNTGYNNNGSSSNSE